MRRIFLVLPRARNKNLSPRRAAPRGDTSNPPPRQADWPAVNAAFPPELVAFAHRLAAASGAVIKRYFRHPVDVAYKADSSPVTLADREVESAIRALIAAEHPDHGIIGEEHEPVRADADQVWVIDPIDGTRAFIAGIPVFGTLIALVRGGVPVLGIIDQPITGERWVGIDGAPTTVNGKPVRTRACGDLSTALLCTSSPHYYQGDDAAAFERLRQAVDWAHYGADCYGFAMLASGCIDLGIEPGMDVHDYFALVPVIEGAGGVITDWRGAPLTHRSDGRVLAAGDRTVHAAALARLAGEAELLS